MTWYRNADIRLYPQSFETEQQGGPGVISILHLFPGETREQMMPTMEKRSMQTVELFPCLCNSLISWPEKTILTFLSFFSCFGNGQQSYSADCDDSIRWSMYAVYLFVYLGKEDLCCCGCEDPFHWEHQLLKTGSLQCTVPYWRDSLSVDYEYHEVKNREHIGKFGATQSLFLSGGTLKISVEMIVDYLEVCIFRVWTNPPLRHGNVKFWSLFKNPRKYLFW